MGGGQSSEGGGAAASNGQRRILMLGLDGAGKTTILYALKLGHKVKTVPTVGFNIEEVTVAGITLTVWDCGGQDKIRELWRYYYEGTEAVVFVVDSRDIDRIEAAKMELHKLVTEDALDGASILVFANKQDLDGALTGEKLIEALGMSSLPDSVQWKVQEAIATENRGLEEGLQWVASTLPAKGWGCSIL